MNNQTNFYRIIEGDSLKVLPSLPSESVDLVVTDPPYGISYHSGYYKNGNPFDKIIGDDKPTFSFIKDCLRVLKNNSALFCFCRIDVFPQLFNELKDFYVNTIVWVKDNWSAGDLTSNFGNQYELIVYAIKGRPKIRGKRYSNVWQFPRVTATELSHPTEKPVDLIERLVKTLSDEDNIILDPFLGSGTTMLACRNLNRSCIGVDISPNYSLLSSKRTQSEAPLGEEVIYQYYKLENDTLVEKSNNKYNYTEW